MRRTACQAAEPKPALGVVGPDFASEEIEVQRVRRVFSPVGKKRIMRFIQPKSHSKSVKSRLSLVQGSPPMSCSDMHAGGKPWPSPLPH